MKANLQTYKLLDKNEANTETSRNFNTTMNGTRPTSCFNPTAETVGKTFAYFVFIIASLTGNTFIVIIVLKTKTMRKTVNFFIVNTATSDLLFPIILLPFMLTELYVDVWSQIGSPLGNALCKLLPFLKSISLSVSIQNLVLIAVDRFGAVVFPFRSPLISLKLCSFFILATWVVAVALHFPFFFIYKLVEHQERMMCAQQWNEVSGNSLTFQNYVLALFVVFLFIPLVLIATLYITINLKLRSQTRPGEQSVNIEQQRVKKERNVLKMSIAIMLWFAVCWLPYSAVELLYFFAWDHTTLSCSIKYLRDVINFMSYANSAINPCICFTFSGNYRYGLKTLLKRHLVQSRVKQGTPRQVRNISPASLVLTSFVKLNK